MKSPLSAKMRFRLFALASLIGLGAVACATPVVPEAGPPTTPVTTTTTTTTPPTTTTTEPASGQPSPSTEPPPITTTTIPAVVVPGVSEATIRIGVVADVDTGGVADGRSRSAWGAVAAWAESVNSLGGLAGRQVEVVYLDTGLYGHAGAIQRACDEDIFALVGSDALFDHEGLGQLGGEDCPVLDFPAVAYSPQRKNREQTYLSNPTPQNVYQVGPLRFLSGTNPEGQDAAAMVLFEDLPTAEINGDQMIEAASALGYTMILEPTTQLETLMCAPEGLYSEMVTQGVSALLWPTDGIWLANFLARGTPTGEETEAQGAVSETEEEGESEAGGEAEPPPSYGYTCEAPVSETEDEPEATEPLDLRFALCDNTCSRQEFTDELSNKLASSQPDGDQTESTVLLWTNYLPLDEVANNRNLALYVITLPILARADDRLPQTPDLQGLASWAAALLFQEAVRLAVLPAPGEEASSPLTTEAVLEAVSGITQWDARGLHAPTNPADKIPNPCFVLLAYQPPQETTPGTPPTQSSWQRQHPPTASQNQWDCAPENLYTLRITGGLQAEGS